MSSMSISYGVSWYSMGRGLYWRSCTFFSLTPSRRFLITWTQHRAWQRTQRTAWERGSRKYHGPLNGNGIGQQQASGRSRHNCPPRSVSKLRTGSRKTISDLWLRQTQRTRSQNPRWRCTEVSVFVSRWSLCRYRGVDFFPIYCVDDIWYISYTIWCVLKLQLPVNDQIAYFLTLLHMSGFL